MEFFNFTMKLTILLLYFCGMNMAANGHDEDTNSIPALILVCKQDGCRITQKSYLSIEKKDFDVIISACPAPKDINDQSFTGKALLASSYKEVEKVPENFCQTVYEPSMVKALKTDDEEYHVGYELYFKKNRKRIHDIPRIKDKSFSSILTTSRNENTDTIKENYRWITILPFIFDTNYGEVNRVTQNFQIQNFDLINLPQPQPCPNYTLGNELFKKIKEDVKNLYNLDHQYNLFQTYYKPKNRPYGLKNQLNDPNDEKQTYFNTHESLSMQQLVTSDDFPFYGTNLLTCTYVNTVPLWQMAAYNWMLINAYTRELARHVQKLEVLSGAYGTTEMRELNKHNNISFYLYRTFGNLKIRVPKLLYKVIRYPVYLDNPEKEVIYYSFVIVMHNNVRASEVIEKDLVCKYNACEQFGCGLSSIYFQRGTVYCCRADEKTLIKLKIQNFSTTNDFNLKAVDVYGDGLTDFKYARDLSKVTKLRLQEIAHDIIKKNVQLQLMITNETHLPDDSDIEGGQLHKTPVHHDTNHSTSHDENESDQQENRNDMQSVFEYYFAL